MNFIKSHKIVKTLDEEFIFYAFLACFGFLLSSFLYCSNLFYRVELKPMPFSVPS